MTLIGRYLAREIGIGVLMVLSGFLALFAFFDLVNELDDLGRGAYRIGQVLIYVALTLPGRIYELMPVAALIGSIFALAQFASHSEFTAFRAAGMGRMQALKAILLASAGFVVLTLRVGEVIAPPSERLAQRVRMTALGTDALAQFRSGMWVKDTARGEAGTAESLRFVNIGRLLPNGTMEAVQIFEFTPDFSLKSVIRAAQAEFSGRDEWRLSDIEETRFVSGQTPEGAQTLQSRVIRESHRSWRTEIGPDIVRVSMVDPARMSLMGLMQYTRHLKDNQQNADRYEIAMWKKIVYPLAVVVMMMLALPFGYLQVRSGGVGYKVFAGIMLGVTFHFMNGLFSHLGLLNTWPAWLAVSIPSLVALSVALALLAWVGTMR
jgi:lipopolysaccharide export system permease protein